MGTEAEEITSLVLKAQEGETRAYDGLVRQFQDRALAYALSLLGDFHLAQDAAQDAFVQAYRDLPTLREPAAFAGWLRRIVFKYCDRLKRHRSSLPLPLEALYTYPSPELGPAELAQRRALEASVHQAIESLPPQERAVTTLFYMGARSYQEIAAFLEVPVTTVKSRLHSARGRLKERMLVMMQNGLEGMRPSHDDEFTSRVRQEISRAITQVAAGDAAETEIRQHHPQARYRDPHPVFALIVSLIRWALAQKAHEVQLVPDEDAVTVLFAQGETLQPVMALPKLLEEPLVARLKDGASLDVEVNGTAQEGWTPVYDAHESKLYDMVVSCRPSEYGEKMILRLIPHEHEEGKSIQ